MMNKIKSFIIHLFGGYTESDMNKTISEIRRVNFENKKNFIHIVAKIHKLYVFSNEQYGKPTEEWCKQVYAKIVDTYDYSLNKEFKD